MKALTLTQPWASLVALGEKNFETRSWPPPRGMVGSRLAIHAAKGVAPIGGEKAFASLCEDWDDSTDDHGPFGQALFVKGRYAVPQNLPRGAVVAIARLYTVIETRELQEGWELWEGEPSPARFEREFGDYSPGRFAWGLTDIVRVRNPIPAVGHQQIWEWKEPYCPICHGAGVISKPYPYGEITKIDEPCATCQKTGVNLDLAPVG